MSSTFELPVLLQKGTQAYTCAVSCKAGCCQHVSLPIDTPRSDREFDDLRWYVMHEDTHVYKFEGTWFLLVLRRCRHLRADNLCGIYERRPKICDEYDAKECEYTGPVAYDLYFKDDDELDAWLAARKAARRRPKPTPPPTRRSRPAKRPPSPHATRATGGRPARSGRGP